MFDAWLNVLGCLLACSFIQAEKAEGEDDHSEYNNILKCILFFFSYSFLSLPLLGASMQIVIACSLGEREKQIFMTSDSC